MIEISFSVTNIAASTAHVIPALSPLLYIAIGYPSPDLWFTPFDIQKVWVLPFRIIKRKNDFFWYKKKRLLLNVPLRSPFFARSPLGFFIAVATSEFITRMYIAGFKAFIATYVVTCVNIESFADDISANVDRLNANILRNDSVKTDLLQVVELHLHSYKWESFNPIECIYLFVQWQ